MVDAYVMIMAATGTATDLLAAIRELEGVERANIVAGDVDIVALVRTDTERQLLRLVTDEIHPLEGVGNTRTCIILA